MIFMDEAKAGGFYAEHKERPFFNDLVTFMTSGPLLFRFWKVKIAIALNRDLMGAPILRKLRLVPYAPTLLRPLTLMPYMVRIHLHQRHAKWLTSLLKTKSSQDKTSQQTRKAALLFGKDHLICRRRKPQPYWQNLTGLQSIYWGFLLSR